MCIRDRLRASLYWGFLACWWLSLVSMPIGDATTIVYTGPIFTATFARLFLGERIHWSFGPVMLLDLLGLVLITQPSFLFDDGRRARTEADDARSASYLLGACSALASAVVAGLLPVTTRISVPPDSVHTPQNYVTHDAQPQRQLVSHLAAPSQQQTK